MNKSVKFSELLELPEYKTAVENVKRYTNLFMEKNGRPLYCGVKTYGCQMNVHDSEKISWILKNLGYVEIEDVKKADFIIYNTCLIRENAELKVFGHLGSLKPLKAKNKDLKIALCGCMTQKEHIRDEIKQKYRHVDIIFGTNTIHELPRLIYENLSSRNLTTDILESTERIIEDIDANRKYAFKSYVNIMYGCNNFCTFCVVPHVRGREISRTPQDIISEITDLSKKGYKEIMLLGQNVNSYGNDFNNDYRFHNLLSDINNISGIERIRFMSSHPRDLSDDLINCYGNLNNLCPQIHLPVQSGSDRILKLMNRHYDVDSYLKIVDKVRMRIPDISISTDIIVGFPGETDEDFEKTLDLIRRVKYDAAFTFIYSVRKGTVAAKMENQVPEKVKHERIAVLNNLMNEYSLEYNEKLMGTVQYVLAEELSKNNDKYLTGRTFAGKIVHFKGGQKLIGHVVPVKIEKIKTFTLEGTAE